jgi:heat shock protein HtpX
LNLLEQQEQNRRRTWQVIAVLIGVVVVVGAGLDFFVIGHGQAYVPIATIGAMAFGGGSAWLTLKSGDRAILASAGAQRVDERIGFTTDGDVTLRYRQFQNVVEEVAIASGLPVPKAYVIPDNDPNAFATGRDPDHASIAVTEGLLKSLNREELQAVVAHEMGHIRNYDIRLMMVVSAMMGAVVLLASWARRSMRFGGGPSLKGRRGKSAASTVVLLVLWLAAIMVAPLVARLLAMCVSRTREYLADASSAELTRNPLALAAALEKIEDASAPTVSIQAGAAALCISDPLERKSNDKEGHWANLWATHPPIAKRIAALKAMGYQYAARERAV